MGKVFGIDLGTTYSCIAYIDENGKPVVLKNAEGDLTTPSAVFFETQTDALYLRIYADTFLNKAISPSDYQYERNESLSDDELLYYNEIQEILKSINAQMSKHEIDHCKGIVI